MTDDPAAHKRMMDQRKANNAAKAEVARLKRRRLIRIEIAAFAVSAIVVVWLLYYDTTGVSEDFFALQLRFGKVVGVHEGGGHLYRIPILDRVVLIDRGRRPMPALRRTVKSSAGTSVSYEALLTYSVIDPEKYWTRFHGVDADGARLVAKTVETVAGKNIAQADNTQLAEPDMLAKLGAGALDAVNGELADAGLAVRDLRFVTLRLMP